MAQSTDLPVFITPFALEGEREDIPQQRQSSGAVSYAEGWGYDYERNPATDSDAKDIQRKETNGLFYALTAVLRQYQTQGVFPYILPEQNGGAAFAYAKKARCLYMPEGGEADIYESLVDNNTFLPTDATKWRKVSDIVPPSRTITTTAPLTGGGALDKDLTLGIDKKAIDPFFLGEFYYFRHPILKPGFQPAQGGIITDAATRYPEAWAYFQTDEGKMLCKSEAEWQAMVNSVFHTLADGTKIGWNGIGGAPFFVQDLMSGTLRMPDLRGMYAEAAGFDALGVGGTHGDRIRNIRGGLYVGQWTGGAYPIPVESPSGALDRADVGTAQYGTTVAQGLARGIAFNAARVVPTGPTNAPRAWGALACCYLGAPR